MPNWCSNYAVLTGAKEDVDKLKNALQRKIRVQDDIESFWWAPLISSDEDKCKNQFLFGRTLNYEDLGCEHTREEFGYFDAIKYIGTKWDPDFDLSDSAPTVATIIFNSAWSPPCRAMLILAKKYNLALEHEYEEGGCDFGGCVSYDPKTEEVWAADTEYLHWRYLIESPDMHLQEFLEDECGDWLEQDDLAELCERAKMWCLDKKEITKGPFSYEDYIMREMQLKDLGSIGNG